MAKSSTRDPTSISPVHPGWNARVPMSDPARATPPSLLLATMGVVYFAEGLPCGLVNELFPLYLRLQCVGLGEIGLISLVGGRPRE